jgi:ribosomal protein L37AE/L43A
MDTQSYACNHCQNANLAEGFTKNKEGIWICAECGFEQPDLDYDSLVIYASRGTEKTTGLHYEDTSNLLKYTYERRVHIAECIDCINENQPTGDPKDLAYILDLERRYRGKDPLYAKRRESEELNKRDIQVIFDLFFAHYYRKYSDL